MACLIDVLLLEGRDLQLKDRISHWVHCSQTEWHREPSARCDNCKQAYLQQCGCRCGGYTGRWLPRTQYILCSTKR
jgi:hypothetical protein